MNDHDSTVSEDAATDHGFYGVEVDPTPNHEYTMAAQAAKLRAKQAAEREAS